MNETSQTALGPAEALTTSSTRMWETLDGMVDAAVAMIPNLVIAIVVLAIFYVGARLVRSGVRRATRNHRGQNVGVVVGRLAQMGVLFLGLLVSLSILAPSIEPADLLATLGVGGVAIGFAFRDILQNFLAGILILLREPFREGDAIQHGDFEGVVEKVDTRSTMLRTFDGRRVIIPNGEMYTNPVIVNTAYEKRRGEYSVGIGYDDDLDDAQEVMLEVLGSTEGVLQDPAPVIHVVELGDSAVVLRARWWTETSETVSVKSRVISGFKKALDASGIDMPYPTQVTLLRASDPATQEQAESAPRYAAG